MQRVLEPQRNFINAWPRSLTYTSRATAQRAGSCPWSPAAMPSSPIRHLCAGGTRTPRGARCDCVIGRGTTWQWERPGYLQLHACRQDQQARGMDRKVEFPRGSADFLPAITQARMDAQRRQRAHRSAPELVVNSAPASSASATTGRDALSSRWGRNQSHSTGGFSKEQARPWASPCIRDIGHI